MTDRKRYWEVCDRCGVSHSRQAARDERIRLCRDCDDVDPMWGRPSLWRGEVLE